MAVLLHILTKPEDPLAQEMIRAQQNLPGNEIEIVDLTGTEPDYRELLEKVFAADCAQVW